MLAQVSNVAKKKTPRYSYDALSPQESSVPRYYRNSLAKSIAGSNTPSHKNISVLGSRQSGTRNNPLTKKTRNNNRYLNEETSIFNLDNASYEARAEDSGDEPDTQSHKGGGGGGGGGSGSKSRLRIHRKKSNCTESSIHERPAPGYYGNAMTDSIEIQPTKI